MAEVGAGTAADGLRDHATRVATLDALEAHEGPHELDCALAAAIVETMALAGEFVDARTFQRLGFLLGRMQCQVVAGEDTVALFAAMCGDGRLAALYSSTSNPVAVALAKSQLTSDDALTMAALDASVTLACDRHGGASSCFEAMIIAAGLSVPEYWAVFKAHPLGTKRLTSDALPNQLITLAIEMLRSPERELPQAVAAGLFQMLVLAFSGRPTSQQHALDSGLCEVSVAYMRAAGRPEHYISISGGVSCLVARVLCANFNIRVDTRKERWVSSGLLDELIAILQAFEARGVEAVGDTCMGVVFGTLILLCKLCREPSCRPKIRGLASALKFAIDNDLLNFPLTGASSAGYATQVCAAMFGREEGGGFTFSQAHVDAM
jgi:hypothetical protein